MIEPEKPNLDTLIEDTTEDYWAGSGAGPEDALELNRTETRESLTHEASDQDAVSTLIVFNIILWHYVRIKIKITSIIDNAATK